MKDNLLKFLDIDPAILTDEKTAGYATQCLLSLIGQLGVGDAAANPLCRKPDSFIFTEPRDDHEREVLRLFVDGLEKRIGKPIKFTVMPGNFSVFVDGLEFSVVVNDLPDLTAGPPSATLQAFTDRVDAKCIAALNRGPQTPRKHYSAIVNGPNDFSIVEDDEPKS